MLLQSATDKTIKSSSQCHAFGCNVLYKVEVRLLSVSFFIPQILALPPLWEIKECVWRSVWWSERFHEAKLHLLPDSTIRCCSH